MTTTTPPVGDRFDLLRFTKEYWFLVTLATSLILSGVYMYVFHVTPWDTYKQIELRRERVALFDQVGQHLLESGQYEAALAEFDRALMLDPLDDQAQAGRYLTRLFIELPKPTWEATVFSAERDALNQLARGREKVVGHVIEKYLGDVERELGHFDDAATHYQKAIMMKPDYPDALYEYGWLCYAAKPDRPRMESLLRDLTKADPYDYRGFHGLGYALYMRALTEPGEAGIKLIQEAAKQSQRGAELKFQQLNVTMDFGEVARVDQPRLSMFFHKQGMRLLDDPQTATLQQVQIGLEAKLLKSGYEESVYIETDKQRHAWANYELALDYLAASRKDSNDPDQARKEAAEHDRLLKTARALDPDGEMYPIYRDHLAILDQFVPVPAPREPARQTSR